MASERDERIMDAAESRPKETVVDYLAKREQFDEDELERLPELLLERAADLIIVCKWDRLLDFVYKWQIEYDDVDNLFEIDPAILAEAPEDVTEWVHESLGEEVVEEESGAAPAADSMDLS